MSTTPDLLESPEQSEMWSVIQTTGLECDLSSSPKDVNMNTSVNNLREARFHMHQPSVKLDRLRFDSSFLQLLYVSAHY